jgi:uncharacterized membrane protein YagU involved in acid resistance
MHSLARIRTGALAGCAATVPMTVVMADLDQAPPRPPKHSFPPRQIAEEALVEVSLEHDLPEPAKKQLTALAHFGFGSAMGAGYSLLPEKYLIQQPFTCGITFGLAVWATSYLGLLPSLNSEAAATEETPRRNAVMIAAHIVWGATLGYLTKEMVRCASTRGTTG